MKTKGKATRDIITEQELINTFGLTVNQFWQKCQDAGAAMHNRPVIISQKEQALLREATQIEEQIQNAFGTTIKGLWGHIKSAVMNSGITNLQSVILSKTDRELLSQAQKDHNDKWNSML